MKCDDAEWKNVEALEECSGCRIQASDKERWRQDCYDGMVLVADLSKKNNKKNIIVFLPKKKI